MNSLHEHIAPEFNYTESGQRFIVARPALRLFVAGKHAVPLAVRVMSFVEQDFDEDKFYMSTPKSRSCKRLGAKAFSKLLAALRAARLIGDF